MIKRIGIDQLKPGMYIHDLNCGWMEHPFAFNRFAVTDEETVKKIITEGIKALYIDTRQGLDVVDAQPQKEFNSEMQQKLVDVVNARRAVPKLQPVASVALKDELDAARTVHGEANKVIHGIMSDVRLGKQIKLEQAQPVVESAAESIFRNPDALVSLSRIKQKDGYTFFHSVSVCALLIAFCRAMEYESELIMEAGMGGLLHDIGKMRVSNSILNKPSQLTGDEFEVMKTHAALGRDLMKQTKDIPIAVVQIIGQHHERYDGSGYPDHLHQDEISKLGQMAAIVDVYDALTSNRVYHTGMEPTAALKKLYEWSSHHFNPDLVRRFIQAIGIYPVGALVRLQSGLIGVVIQPGRENLLHPVVRVVFDRNRNLAVMPPFDIDLAQTSGDHAGDAIVKHEEPRRWGIDPYAFL